ncbi:unnamed protein product [Nippostrongylus brasiliensis]|uniref:Homospermidine synthase n=1 Tax=Nippostrongylus brasiliensis TaxID=27835 RepID=A0A0N4XF07_NIPBR|nr:unnamed protein product [Nippostrongylus brasiliensis]
MTIKRFWIWKPTGVSPEIHWYSDVPSPEDMKRLFKDIEKCQQGEGIVYLGPLVNASDVCVLADLVQMELYLIPKIKFNQAESKCRLWASSAYCPDMPFGRVQLIVIICANRSSVVLEPFADWWISHGTPLLSSEHYKAAILRVAQVTFGQDLGYEGRFEYRYPLGGWYAGADFTVPKPCFKPPLAAAYSTFRYSNHPDLDQCLLTVAVKSDELFRAGIAWHIAIACSIQALMVRSKYHPYMVAVAMGLPNDDGALHMNPTTVQVGEGLFDEERKPFRENEKAVPCQPGMTSVIMKEMFGLEMSVIGLWRGAVGRSKAPVNRLMPIVWNVQCQSTEVDYSMLGVGKIMSAILKRNKDPEIDKMMRVLMTKIPPGNEGVYG